jgi:CDP-diacylglycerol---serine O-phosphatidyltransferase
MIPKIIPSLFTLTNLLLGVLSLIYTMNEQYQMSAIMILLSMILDGMDGKLARRLDATSAFGKELDSLSDLVSFGVAPAILIYASEISNLGWHGYLGLFLALAFALCGAIRLARFNVLDITDHFIGVPITAAGSLLALLELLTNRIPDIVFPVAILLLAGLMVSNIKVPKY